MSARPLLILFGASASVAVAAPTIDPQFGDHAVIQRDRNITLTGNAAPNSQVSIAFAGEDRPAKADANGRWSATFAPRKAGGPYTITATTQDGSTKASDVMVGDVWLCSGQSNMEYPLRRSLNGDGEVSDSTDHELRLFKVPRQLGDSPAVRFTESPAWKASSPEASKEFSAVCYFLARDIRKTEKVPVGAIDDSWGGTPIRAWVTAASARAGGGGPAVDVLELYRKDPVSALRRFGSEWGNWWRSKTGDKPGNEPWHASDRLTWKAVPSLTYWDDWGPEWASWIGSAWIRDRVTLTAGEAAQDATLKLSAIDDMDQTFVNGVAVGGRNDPTNPRAYALPKGTLKAGSNEIMIFARNSWGRGGLAGPADQFALNFADGHSKPLIAGWQVSRIPDSVGEPHIAPWIGSSGVATIYNAMIAPLGALGLKGVAWYQGESDVGKAGYDDRLAALMANWRTQFRTPQLPFLVVGLAGYGKATSSPVESGWAALINEQRLATKRDPNATLVSAIDIGEALDVHPANKQEVGRRLALAAHSLAYHDGGAVGPLPVSAIKQGNTIVVTFTKPLESLGSANANGFELCGPLPTSCRFSIARVSGASVVIPSDALPVTRVRYAWADFPLINLYDRDRLPVPVFELTVQ